MFKKEQGFSLVELAIAAGLAVALAATAVTILSGTTASLSSKANGAAGTSTTYNSDVLANASGAVSGNNGGNNNNNSSVSFISGINVSSILNSSYGFVSVQENLNTGVLFFNSQAEFEAAFPIGSTVTVERATGDYAFSATGTVTGYQQPVIFNMMGQNTVTYSVKIENISTTGYLTLPSSGSVENSGPDMTITIL